jgi:hypothetical protein
MGTRLPPGVIGQDEVARLWDLLWLLACAIRRGGAGPEVRFARSWLYGALRREDEPAGG